VRVKQYISLYISIHIYIHPTCRIYYICIYICLSLYIYIPILPAGRFCRGRPHMSNSPRWGWSNIYLFIYLYISIYIYLPDVSYLYLYLSLSLYIYTSPFYLPDASAGAGLICPIARSKGEASLVDLVEDRKRRQIQLGDTQRNLKKKKLKLWAGPSFSVELTQRLTWRQGNQRPL